MRQIVPVLLVLCVAGSASGREEETLLSGPVTSGGFGGPVVKMTRMHDSFGVLIGGRGGWIINHTLSLGGGGYGLVSRIRVPEGVSGLRDPVLRVGYGGFEVGYTPRSDRLIHPALSLLIGGGSAGTRESWEEDLDDDWEDDPSLDSFFILEPGAAVELNLTRFMRVDAGVSCRFVSGLERDGLAESAIGGPSAVLTFKFGSF
ncbi:MAG: hypothetical protein QUS35_04290 [bacterium]|nr:hypothetical protein [bacterium]